MYQKVSIVLSHVLVMTMTLRSRLKKKYGNDLANIQLSRNLQDDYDS